MNRRDTLIALFALGPTGPLAARAQLSRDKTARIGILVAGSRAQRGHLEQPIREMWSETSNPCLERPGKRRRFACHLPAAHAQRSVAFMHALL